MVLFLRALAALPLALLSPLLIAIPLLTLAVEDLLWRLFGRAVRPARPQRQPVPSAATVVIPNWNGRDLLEKYLPSVIEAMSGNSDNEVIVVDNGSQDGSAEFVREAFPSVRLIALPTNEGFGGGSNTGFRAAKNDVVVLLNSDMRVERDFLQPLLDGFTDDHVFAVSCQIFLSDPAKRREETGLTLGEWERGHLRVGHRIDEQITDLFPCFYAGGGSSAYDRKKFLELGGFDSLLAPFYLEDTDLGYMAWKRGWKVLYQPKSIVFHEHRGTIGKKFSPAYIESVLRKNFLLFCWKNIHEWHRLGSHFFHVWADCLLSFVFGNVRDRANLRGLWRAVLALPAAVASRWRARRLSVVDDTEAFRRPLGGYYRDRFAELPTNPGRLRVLFVSPYPICPPTHGGGVFMYQTSMELARLTELHLVTLLDYPHERKAHEELAQRCASAEFLVRMKGTRPGVTSLAPHAVNEFESADLKWIIHRQIYLKQIDVLQLEYLTMGQYAGQFHRLASILFEHDVYFQSIARQLPNMKGPIRGVKARVEYLRALRYELKLLPGMDRIQVCSRDNGEYLRSFLPQLDGRIDDDLRAGIDTTRYQYVEQHREPETMLFLGSFRHLPNQEALDWFIRKSLPHVLAARPNARLIVIGSDPPPRHSLPASSHAIELHGFVEDVRVPLSEYAVFICPILSGSGVRVKLLEAFAAGIPVVSTTMGAEGLAQNDGEICALADDPEEFAGKIVEFFENPAKAAQIAARARKNVEQRDMALITRKLEISYRAAISEKRSTSSE